MDNHIYYFPQWKRDHKKHTYFLSVAIGNCYQVFRLRGIMYLNNEHRGETSIVLNNRSSMSPFKARRVVVKDTRVGSSVLTRVEPSTDANTKRSKYLTRNAYGKLISFCIIRCYKDVCLFLCYSFFLMFNDIFFTRNKRRYNFKYF